MPHTVNELGQSLVSKTDHKSDLNAFEDLGISPRLCASPDVSASRSHSGVPGTYSSLSSLGASCLGSLHQKSKTLLIRKQEAKTIPKTPAF